MKEETLNKLDQVTAKTGHSRNELIGMLLDYALEHSSVEEK